MNKVVRSVLILFVAFLLTKNAYFASSFAIAIVLILEILNTSYKQFVFREWALLLYAINYLVAPAITYSLKESQVQYGMKILSEEYYSLALPGFLFLCMGMYILPTNLFKVQSTVLYKTSVINQSFLFKVAIFGIVMRLSQPFVAGDIGFFVYLLSLIRFVAAFALISINKRMWYVTFSVLLIELIFAFVGGMYHDAIMWCIFFGLYYVYVFKPSKSTQLIAFSAFFTFILFIQAIKSVYRSEVWSGEKEASIANAYEIGAQNASTETVYGISNLLGTLNRSNQAWIFASTVDNMDRNQNFQGLTNVNKYLEAALLPRFLAPNKIQSGDKEIFNAFSGHTINQGTSMGLGIFADGYIAYGAWGVYVFGFALGLIFALTFKLVERWTRVSPFYVLLLLPLLNYAVRPDCELQTTVNHLTKGIMVYGTLVYLTKKRFTLDSAGNQRKFSQMKLSLPK